MTHPILYTFRRCPYAIRARMALAYAEIGTQQIEVNLKNKPEDMLKASAKGTVPVLILENGTVIDESLDIMNWALSQSDPDSWIDSALKRNGDALIFANDFLFKPVLDGYKYSQHQDEALFNTYREKAKLYLNQLNDLLTKNHYLLGDRIQLADIAIFPFIRQFYKVDVEWFEASDYKKVYLWLHSFLDSNLFIKIMQKQTMVYTE